jgi:hypothetical protein
LDLVAGARVAMDGSQVNAVHATARHFTQDKLTTRRQPIDHRLEGDLQDLAGQDHPDAAGTPGGAVADHVQAKLAALQHRKLRDADWPAP